MGASPGRIGIANKVIGIWLTILGAFIGGLIMTRLALYRSLLLFGVLQLVSNFGFYLLGGAFGNMPGAQSWCRPSTGASWRSTRRPRLDWLLLTVIAGENISGGMGIGGLRAAPLMGLCNQRFTATHYAMRRPSPQWADHASPLSGRAVAEHRLAGLLPYSIVVAVPGVVMVWWLRDALARLGRPQTDGVKDDRWHTAVSPHAASSSPVAATRRRCCSAWRFGMIYGIAALAAGVPARLAHRLGHRLRRRQPSSSSCRCWPPARVSFPSRSPPACSTCATCSTAPRWLNTCATCRGAGACFAGLRAHRRRRPTRWRCCATSSVMRQLADPPSTRTPPPTCATGTSSRRLHAVGGLAVVHRRRPAVRHHHPTRMGTRLRRAAHLHRLAHPVAARARRPGCVAGGRPRRPRLRRPS